MTSRSWILTGVGCFAFALLAFLFADTGATLTDEVRRGCADWWCAPANRLPVGIGVLLSGLGIVAVGIGLNGSGPHADDDGPPRPPHHPEGRSRSATPGHGERPRPLWSRDRRPSP